MERSGMRKLALVAALAIIGVLALFAWSQYSARQEAERTLGLDASRVLSERFSKASALKVGTLRGEVLARGNDKGFMGVVPSEQTTKVPFTVDYFVDLTKIDQRSYRWDAASRTLTVEVPDVTVAKPNIDEQAAQVSQKGIFISRRAALELGRQTSKRAAARSQQVAQKPENLAKARENARSAVVSMAQGSLAAVGFGDVRVAAAFPWEAKAPSLTSEQWDRSRRIEDVLEERRNATR